MRQRNFKRIENENLKTCDQRSTKIDLKPDRFLKLFGFRIDDLSSWSKFINILHRPTDPAGLGITRILFGFLMIIDIPQERGLSFLEAKWGNPDLCHFPLFNFMNPLPLPWMYIIYLIMSLGALGICLGFFYRLSCLMFIIPYWYVFLLDKTVWNNHSYLYGLLSILLLVSDGNRFWSLDGVLNKKIRNASVPLWNYAILRAQVFIVYFFAGLKKLDQEWLKGYPMISLSEHWVFDPFKFFLTNDQIDFYIVHMNGFLLDLTIGYFLFFDQTRPVAMVFGAAFNLMNAQIFTIGMFPYMMIAVMPLFCYGDWPKKIIKKLPKGLSLVLPVSSTPQTSNHCLYPKQEKKGTKKPKDVQLGNIKSVHKLAATGFIIYLSIQAFLPYSHFITKGYNNWTNGLYGYSWDMMVHSWKTQHIRISCIDKTTQELHYLDPEVWTFNQRWANHADMLKQLADCISHKLVKYNMTEVELYFDVWRSLNLRFQQRLFNPLVDILTAEWSPFQETSWVMPLLNNLSDWRWNLELMQRKLYDTDNFTSVVFVADFPGLFLENFIDKDFGNTSLEVLEGTIVVEFVKKNETNLLEKGMRIQLPPGEEHMVHTILDTPSCYMYVFVNTTYQVLAEKLLEYENMRHNLKLEKGISNLPKFQQQNIELFETLIKEKEQKQNRTAIDYYTKFWKEKFEMFRKSAAMLGKAVISIVTNSPLQS